MKQLPAICVALCVSLCFTAAFARGGSHHSVTTGGAAGTSPSAPGTNSSGTALSSSGTAHPMKGPALGTNPVVDREEAKVSKMIASICRGC
jgi:hypothetical protein